MSCLDCGCRIDDEPAHTKFHAILSGQAWAMAEVLAEVAKESQLKADPVAGSPASVVRSDEVGPTVYLSIGNTDGKLSPQAWSEFVNTIDIRVASMATEALWWFSNPRDPWQSSCWMLQFMNEPTFLAAQALVTEIRKQYRQDSAAWAFVAETKFI